MVRSASPGFGLLFCALSLRAQDDVATTQQLVTITGAVVDAETGAPVAGATVALRYANAPAPLDRAVTEAPGTFELTVKEPGRYIVEASAPGYLETVSSENRPGIPVGEAEFEPGASLVPHRVELRLPGSSGLKGVVVDGDTRKPAPLVTVRAIRLWWDRGKREATEERIVFTDDDGAFRLGPLAPGDYAVMLGNTSAAVAQMRANADEARVYPAMVWPEGAGESGFVPLAVRPASELDLGVIGYSKVIPPRIRAPECAAEATANIWMAQQIGGAWFELGHEPGSICGWVAPIPPLSRGRYRLTDLPSPAAKMFRMGKDEVTIRGEGDAPEVKAQMLPMAQVTGTVTCECEEARMGSAEPVGVQISPVFGDTGMAEAVKAGENGAFSGMAAIEGDALIGVSGIPAGLFVKRLMFNGAESGKMVSMHFGEPVSIGIVLSDKPATVTGTVKSALPQEHVAMAIWPVSAGVHYVDFYSATVDDGGGFTIKNVAPGEYRAAAVGPEQWERREMPNEVADWLAGAEGFAVGEGETKTIRIEGMGR